MDQHRSSWFAKPVSNYNCRGILRLHFHDLSRQISGDGGALLWALPDDEYRAALRLFNEDDAKAVVQFVKSHIDSIMRINIHCDAGVSRSAGIAASLSKWLNKNTNCIDPRRHGPNPLVVKLMDEATGIYSHYK